MPWQFLKHFLKKSPTLRSATFTPSPCTRI